MNEIYREQRPLLCDDFSDDDLNTQNCSPRSIKRMRAIVYSGQARNQMKGAAVILKSWPEHWWSDFKWWMGLGMIAIVVLIVYNSVIAFSMLPMAYTKAIKTRTPYSNSENALSENLSLSDIYMHVFAKNKNEIDLNDFLPYVEVMSKRYQDFKFHFIVVINEMFEGIGDMNDETKNILALNSLWTDESYENNHRFIDNNLDLSYISINKYLSNPSLQKICDNVSRDLIEFLVRILSIWEKGGIAFNPLILTPRSPNALYMEKIQNLLNNYKELQYMDDTKIKENIRQSIELHKPKRKFNNIRDIINALEEDEKLYNVSQHNLTEMENKLYSFTVKPTKKEELLEKQNVSYTQDINQTESYHNDKQSDIMLKEKNNTLYENNYFITKPKHILKTDVIDVNTSRSSTQSSLLPLFLEFLFPKETALNYTHKRDKKASSHKIRYERDNYYTSVFSKNNKKESYSHYKLDKRSLDYEEKTKLTIDLKGNVVASNIPCHAFIGNLLRNAAHHKEEETLTEYITAELTNFCKGVVSSCKGIDVILI